LQANRTLPSVECGDVVLLRSVYGGRVRWTFPHRVVATEPRLALHVCPGTPGKLMKRGYGKGAYVEPWARGDPPVDWLWQGGHALRLLEPGAAHAIELYWDPDWRLRGWHLNLQTPAVVRDGRIDMTDQALDVWVEPDGTWRWKDEDDFAQKRALGVYDVVEAGAIRAEGERLIEAWPLPTGWEDWRPDPSWPVPELPADWDVV
jgi:hypothetical protein